MTECTLNALAFLFVSLSMVVFNLSCIFLNIMLVLRLFYIEISRNKTQLSKLKSLFWRNRSATNVHFPSVRLENFKNIVIGLYFHLKITKAFPVLFQLWDEVMEFAISWPWLVNGVHPIQPIVNRMQFLKKTEGSTSSENDKYCCWYPSSFATSSLSAAEAASRKARGPLVRSHSQLWRWTASGKLDVIAAEKAKDLTSSALRKLDVWTVKLFQLCCYAPLEAWAEKS